MVQTGEESDSYHTCLAAGYYLVLSFESQPCYLNRDTSAQQYFLLLPRVYYPSLNFYLYCQKLSISIVFCHSWSSRQTAACLSSNMITNNLRKGIFMQYHNDQHFRMVKNQIKPEHELTQLSPPRELSIPQGWVFGGAYLPALWESDPHEN